MRGHTGEARRRRRIGVATIAAFGVAAAPASALNASVGDATVAESAGTVSVQVTPVCGTLETTLQPVVLSVVLATGTASGADFGPAATPASVSLGCLAGVPTGAQAVTVPIADDTLDEPDETFTVDTATQSVRTGHVTITDDDPTPSVRVDAASATEGSAIKVPVMLSAASGRRTLVHYAVTGTTATPGTDFTPVSGDLPIPAGLTSATVSVPTVADTVDEGDETVAVTLSNPTDATLGTATATGTITDDDAPVLSIGDATGPEGTGGQTTFGFDVVSDHLSTRTISVAYHTADVPGEAVAGQDYAPTSGRVTIPPGQATGHIDVAVTPDAAVEGTGSPRAERFAVVLSDPLPAGATIAPGGGTGTILDDDTAPAGSGATGAGGASPFGGAAFAAPSFPKQTGVAPATGRPGTPRLGRPKLAKSRKTAKVAISCPAGVGACRGTLTLTASGKRIGRSGFFVVAGHRETLVLSVSKASRAKLKRIRHPRLVAKTTS